MSVPATMPARGRSLVRDLGLLGWLIIVGGGALGVVLEIRSGAAPNDIGLLLFMLLFFSVLVARLGVSLVRWPERRLALGALVAAVVLWAAGSVVVSGAGSADTATFPSHGEWLFLCSYIGFAAFVVLDAGHRKGGATTAWLDALIVCGSGGALAAVLLLTPFMRSFPEGGTTLLAALIYPVLDLCLALVVVGQWALASRTLSRRAMGLILGFVIMAIADSSLVLKLSSGPYAFTITLILLWAIALMLIVGAACTPRQPQAVLGRRLPEWFLVVSFLLAVTLLVIRPADVPSYAVAVPATVTLLATAARLTIALRDSRAAAEAFRLALTDDLTGLPNRRAIFRELDLRIPAERPLALLLLDLDSFKEVNDTLGHSAGDTLLELVALRIRESLPANIMFARVGGDEFALVLDTDDPITLMEQAQAIRHTLLARARIDGLDLAMDASIGITIREPTDVEAADLMRRADVAMYEAKNNRTGAQLYNVERDEFTRQRLQMGEELRRALSKGQIKAWYQPKVDSATQHLIGVEALVRWEHPTRGMVLPMLFLPVARRAGLMQQLSEVVVSQAISDSARWRRVGLDIDVAINVAPQEILSGGLMPFIYNALTRTSVPRDGITIEVTEETFLAEPERARELLLDIRRHGLRTSIDDYGTGFSSLAYLRDLPLSELKMDRSFVASVHSDPRSRLIVESTVNMAHALGVHVVAEGVESSEVAAEVTALGVDILQGYFIAPPMRAEDIEEWAREWALPLPPVMRIVPRTVDESDTA